MVSGSKTTEIEGARNALLTAVENFPKTDVEPAVCSAIGKPFISGLLFHNHNILY